MQPELTVANLFAAASLSPCGPVAWSQACGESCPGVYVVTVDGAIVYVGRARISLTRRLGQFYRHKFGAKRPHHGGQDVLNLVGERQVYWCATDDPVAAEAAMLRAFEEGSGTLPVANKRRGDRAAHRGLQPHDHSDAARDRV